MAKKKRTPEQVEKRKKVFKTFERLVIGAVKIWLDVKGVKQPYIVAVDQVDDFIKEMIDSN